jgi:uncharacterized protein Veg
MEKTSSNKLHKDKKEPKAHAGTRRVIDIENGSKRTVSP